MSQLKDLQALAHFYAVLKSRMWMVFNSMIQATPPQVEAKMLVRCNGSPSVVMRCDGCSSVVKIILNSLLILEDNWISFYSCDICNMPIVRIF